MILMGICGPKPFSSGGTQPVQRDTDLCWICHCDCEGNDVLGIIVQTQKRTFVNNLIIQRDEDPVITEPHLEEYEVCETDQEGNETCEKVCGIITVHPQGKLVQTTKTVWQENKLVQRLNDPVEPCGYIITQSPDTFCGD